MPALPVFTDLAFLSPRPVCLHSWLTGSGPRQPSAPQLTPVGPVILWAVLLLPNLLPSRALFVGASLNNRIPKQ